MQSITKLRAPWEMFGGRKKAEEALTSCARAGNWLEVTGINAVDNRVVWMADDEGVTLYFREAA